MSDKPIDKPRDEWKEFEEWGGESWFPGKKKKSEEKVDLAELFKRVTQRDEEE